MVAAIKQTVTVGPGGVVQVSSPELRVGARAEVIVLVDAPEDASPSTPGPGLSSFIGKGKGLFKSVEEVDQFIRSERDQWDR
ncbi:MAG TPA: hypothetical protein VEA69_11910 [Tepidisphaeraceae bacterium]|nr:hypothetical protein [Tepidisphaeraceae bacterium]